MDLIDLECSECFKEFKFQPDLGDSPSEEFWDLTRFAQRQNDSEDFDKRLFICGKCLDFFIDELEQVNQMGQDTHEFLLEEQ